LKQVIRAEKVISHAGPTVKLCFTQLRGGKTKQVCTKFVAALHLKPPGKLLGQHRGMGQEAELSRGSALPSEAASTCRFHGVLEGTGLVSCFSLGSAGFCSFPMGLVLYFAEHDDILRVSADFFVKSGPGNLSAETHCWLVSSGSLNSLITFANALKGCCLPQACRDLQRVYRACAECLIFLFSSGPSVLEPCNGNIPVGSKPPTSQSHYSSHTFGASGSVGFLR